MLLRIKVYLTRNCIYLIFKFKQIQKCQKLPTCVLRENSNVERFIRIEFGFEMIYPPVNSRQASGYYNPLLNNEIIACSIPDFNIYFVEELQCMSDERKQKKRFRKKKDKEKI